jgi:hypothetical protein
MGVWGAAAAIVNSALAAGSVAATATATAVASSKGLVSPESGSCRSACIAARSSSPTRSSVRVVLSGARRGCRVEHDGKLTQPGCQPDQYVQNHVRCGSSKFPFPRPSSALRAPVGVLSIRFRGVRFSEEAYTNSAMPRIVSSSTSNNIVRVLRLRIGLTLATDLPHDPRLLRRLRCGVLRTPGTLRGLPGDAFFIGPGVDNTERGQGQQFPGQPMILPSNVYPSDRLAWLSAAARKRYSVVRRRDTHRRPRLWRTTPQRPAHLLSRVAAVDLDARGDRVCALSPMLGPGSRFTSPLVSGRAWRGRATTRVTDGRERARMATPLLVPVPVLMAWEPKTCPNRASVSVGSVG